MEDGDRKKKGRVQTVYLCRHALKAKVVHHTKDSKDEEEEEGDTEEELNPHDNPLTSAGKKQCKELAKALKDSGIERIFCSPFTRCVHTASYVAKALGSLPIWVDSGLCEWTPGVSPQVVSVESLHSQFPLVQC
jgi:broad specificity phosphatase PhoE